MEEEGTAVLKSLVREGVTEKGDLRRSLKEVRQ